MSRGIVVEVQFQSRKKRMDAYQLSPNLCLLRFDKMRDTVPFVRFQGTLSLTHIPSGLRVCLVEGKEGELVKMAEELETVSDLSQLEVPALTNEQRGKRVYRPSIHSLDLTKNHQQEKEND